MNYSQLRYCPTTQMLMQIPALLLLVITAAVAAPPTSFHPREDPDILLHNPDMGWIIYENYPVDPDPHGSSTMLTLPDEKWDPVDEVAIMFTWADVERADDQFDFSAVDKAYDWWTTRGKKIQLRMSTESLVWWNRHTPPAGLGVPRWLLSRLPADAKQVRTMEGIEYAVVDARNPLYQARLERFLSQVNRHFNQDRPVTMIDLRGFGVWGEWHSGYRYPSPEARHQALTRIIDLWSAAFNDRTLALSYSHDPDGPPDYFAGSNRRYEPPATTHYADFLYYSAFDHALTRPNVTLRRDGAGGAVYSNQRRLCDQAFATMKKGPMIVEFLGGFAQAKKGGARWVEWMIDDALSLHPNYINLLGWQGGDALTFCRERPDLLARGLRNMGYRLVITTVRHPPEVIKGEKFKLTMDWVNRGVGRAVRDYSVQFLWGDEVIDAGHLGCDQWRRGTTYRVEKEISFSKSGSHPLQIRIHDGPRTILLAMEGTGGAYGLGPLQVK